jgi:putative oxidoreductase
MTTIAAETRAPLFAELSANKEGASRYLVPAGRALYAAIFLLAGLHHFSSPLIAHAAEAGVPFANVAVPAFGVIALAGGASILLGYRARVGAALIVLFLVPVTFSMHAFWAVSDPAMRQIQLMMFLKNISMLGAALFIARAGAGPMSLDALRA